jgi:hypothetical protein
MTKKVYVGTDPEFMVQGGKGNYLYPLAIEGYSPLRAVGHDEFGHCIEIRPKEATSGEGLVLNTMTKMAELPKGHKRDVYAYTADNAHSMDRKTFNKLIRAQGGKSLSESKNIYGLDILSDENCPADMAARKKGQRLLFCGMHMHISCYEERTITVKSDQGKDIKHELKDAITLPAKSLTRLFDHYLFDNLRSDVDFDIGRYRSKGFYERKPHGGFEYRSLGASALTPERLSIIADIMIEIVESFDQINFGLTDPKQETTTKKLEGLVKNLKATKPHKGCLRKLWVPWD